MKKIINQLINAYYRLFYFYFRIEKRGYHGMEESDKTATIMALMPVCLFCYCNVLTLLYLISRFLIPLPRIPKAIHVVIVLIITVSNYYWFFRKKRYISIKKMFEGEEDHVRLFRSLFCIAFSLASLFTMAFLIALFGYR